MYQNLKLYLPKKSYISNLYLKRLGCWEENYRVMMGGEGSFVGDSGILRPSYRLRAIVVYAAAGRHEIGGKNMAKPVFFPRHDQGRIQPAVLGGKRLRGQTSKSFISLHVLS